MYTLFQRSLKWKVEGGEFFGFYWRKKGIVAYDETPGQQNWCSGNIKVYFVFTLMYILVNTITHQESSLEEFVLLKRNSF